MKLSMAIIISLLCFSQPSAAKLSERTILPLILTDSGFLPAGFTIPTGKKFMIRMTNKSSRIAELESYDMKFEKIAPMGETISVFAGPLKPGSYRFFNDYSLSSCSGWLVVRGE